MVVDIKDNEAFWSYVGQFGPGFLTVHSIGLCARPIMPTIDRKVGVLTVLVDRDWLKVEAHSYQVVLTYLCEFTRECLVVYGKAISSARPEDIKAVWSLAHERAYPQGPAWSRLVALRTTPDVVETWQLGAGRAARSWKFVQGVIEPTIPVPGRADSSDYR